MTWHEQSWVEIHSPYDGGAYATHLIIAGIVNPDHDYQLYVHPDRLAERCHCSVTTLRRHLGIQVDDGWLEVVDSGGGRGKFAIYRFIKKGSHNDQVSPDGNLVTDDGNLPKSDAQTYPSQECDLLSTKEELKRQKDVTIQNLCEFLQAGVERHRGTKPKITTVWTTDIDLLMRRGSTDWDKPTAVPEAEVARVIRGIYTKLTMRNNGGFCWADQIRSPANLRRHWDELVQALKDRPKSSPNGKHTGAEAVLRDLEAEMA